VDSKLRVHGVRNLRIADASVIPVIPDCRIQNSVYMIGEKVSTKSVGSYDKTDMEFRVRTLSNRNTRTFTSRRTSLILSLADCDLPFIASDCFGRSQVFCLSAN
jgi:hypothetical protein